MTNQNDLKSSITTGDTLVVEMSNKNSYEFLVVGVVEDEEGHNYLIAYSETIDEFIVGDSAGSLLADDSLAQDILDDFFVLAEEAST